MKTNRFFVWASVILILALLANWPRDIMLGKGAMVVAGFPLTVISWSFGESRGFRIWPAFGNLIFWVGLLVLAWVAARRAGATRKIESEK